MSTGILGSPSDTDPEVEAQNMLKLREPNAIEILILQDGQGENNPTTEEKYGQRAPKVRFRAAKYARIKLQAFSQDLSRRVEALGIGRVGIITQPPSLALAYIVDELVSKGTQFIIQLTFCVRPEVLPVSILFMDPISRPVELGEYRGLPVEFIEEFLTQKQAMCALHKRLCKLERPPEIAETEQKLHDLETEFKFGEVERYINYQREALDGMDKFNEIYVDNACKGLVFQERRRTMPRDNDKGFGSADSQQEQELDLHPTSTQASLTNVDPSHQMSSLVLYSPTSSPNSGLSGSGSTTKNINTDKFGKLFASNVPSPSVESSMSEGWSPVDLMI